MGFRCGIVGLPNVGKSTLFNALTATAAAEAANYPFCTIEPNLGRIGVPDLRLDQLASCAESQKIIPSQLEVVDIAGLVRGASKGEGLGNQFLGHIREVDAILHVLRCFEDSNITHVEGSIDPERDAQIIETELMLADLEALDRREQNLQKKSRQSGPEGAEAKALLGMIARVRPVLEAGNPARTLKVVSPEEPTVLKALNLLTSKPILYILNVEEDSAASGNESSEKAAKWAAEQGAGAVVVSAAIEAELAQLSGEERMGFLQSLGLDHSGLHRVAQAGHGLLGLDTFFTVGPKEAHAWTVRRGAKAPEAAGVIHSDFERGFICAETIAWDQFVALGGEAQAKAQGKLRLEGRDYIVQDGDVFHFRFNV